MRAGRSIALTLALVAVADAPISGMPAADAGTRVAARVAVEPTGDSAAPARASPVAPRGNPLWAIPLSDLSATGERPIFSPSRRRPVPDVVVPAAVEPPRPAPMPEEPARPPLVLIGTIVGESRQIGVFLEETTKELVRLATGEDHGGWTLRSVDRQGVQFEKGARAATLMLRPPDQGKGPASATIPMAELNPPVRHRKR
jgi:general secretion pathway protein N